MKKLIRKIIEGVNTLIVGIFLGIQSALVNLRDSFETESQEIPDEEPKRQMDDWDRLIHHDDVTQKEIEMLSSDCPEQIQKAKTAIEEREAEFNEIWQNPELKAALFQEAYLKDADLTRKLTPMHEREGWEDPEEMPESFVGVNEAGDLEEVRFDELPEWDNAEPRQ